ncbi:hypothetical protein ECG_05994 [Echinococcus granulosus]|nr:hypothetical protein ECG_05994 [Echinococcus granulosus]
MLTNANLLISKGYQTLLRKRSFEKDKQMCPLLVQICYWCSNLSTHAHNSLEGRVSSQRDSGSVIDRKWSKDEGKA